MKKPIYSSNLLLRFYTNDGWTREELEECLTQGHVSIKHPNDQSPYYTLDIGSRFDCNKLATKCSQLFRTFNDNPMESDIQFMEKLQ